MNNIKNQRLLAIGEHMVEREKYKLLLEQAMLLRNAIAYDVHCRENMLAQDLKILDKALFLFDKWCSDQNL